MWTTLCCFFFFAFCANASIKRLVLEDFPDALIYLPHDYPIVSYPLIYLAGMSVDDQFLTALAQADFVVVAFTRHLSSLSEVSRIRSSSLLNVHKSPLGFFSRKHVDDVSASAVVLLNPTNTTLPDLSAPTLVVSRKKLAVNRLGRGSVVARPFSTLRPHDLLTSLRTFFTCHLKDTLCPAFYRTPFCEDPHLYSSCFIPNLDHDRRRRKLQGPVHPDHIATHAPGEDDGGEDVIDWYAESGQPAECSNDLSSRDALGGLCDWYDIHPLSCGKHDVINKGFTAKTQCCACYGTTLSIKNEPWEYPENTQSPDVADASDEKKFDINELVNTWQFGIGAGFFVGIILACLLIKICDYEDSAYYDIRMDEVYRNEHSIRQQSPREYKAME